MKTKIKTERTRTEKEIYFKQLKNQKGITLVALVVTIVIMLILAGITISLAFGDGGLIGTAKRAADVQRIAEMKTRIELIVTNWTIQKMLNDNVTVDDLKQALVDGGVTDSKDKITGSDGRYEVVTKDGDTFVIIIDESGNVKVVLKGEDEGGGNKPGGDNPGGDQTQANLSISVTETTTNSIKVQVTTDSLTGNTLTYSYKEQGASDYIIVKQNSNDTNHNFVGLGSNTNYMIKVQLKNSEGKVIAEKELSTKTQQQIIGTVSQKGEITWSNGKATLQLQSTQPTDVIQYQVGSNTGTWIDYTGAIGNLNNGDIVHAKVKGSSTETTIQIIDSIEPTVTVQRGTVNTSSITAVVTARDNQSGIPSTPTYNYYIKKSTDGSFPQSPSYTGSNISNAFTGLTQGTSYDIKVEVRDIAGNKGIGLLNNVRTENVGGASGGLTSGNITLGTVTWSNGLATVTLNTPTSLSIQYQKGSNSTGGWITGGTTVTVTGLQHGDTLYARLWDGTNAGSDASVNIIDDKNPQPARITPSTSTTLVGNAITATITLADNESGINVGNSRWVYTNSSALLGTSNPSLYTGGSFTANSQTISLTSNTAGTYYIHVLSTDNAGNKVETISTAITVTEPLEPIDRSRAGNIEIAFLDTSNRLISANSIVPALGTGMTPIKWNGSSWVTTTKTDSGWFDYTMQRWANAKTADGSMWVWIPRYAYKIEYLASNGTTVTGYSDSRGIVDVNGNVEPGTTKSGVVEINGTIDGKTVSRYVLHPAFQKFATNELTMANGGWKENIPGIWVAKFEASSVEGNSSNWEEQDVITKTIQIIPGVSSWNLITLDKAYTNCKNYNASLNSHMIKNSEWGACIYLSKSIYGINGTIKPNTSTATGGGTGESYKFYTNQSTTGNTTGVYDMSGCYYDYTASYVNNTSSSSYGASLVESTDYHFKQVYSKASSETQTNNYAVNAGHYGDAIYEISTDGSTSWYGGTATMPYGQNKFFVRGGQATAGKPFAFVGLDGRVSGTVRFQTSISQTLGKK